MKDETTWDILGVKVFVSGVHEFALLEKISLEQLEIAALTLKVRGFTQHIRSYPPRNINIPSKFNGNLAISF